MSDSFRDNPHCVTWPTEPGYYWFWGYCYGKDRGKELVLCKVGQIANGLMVSANGHFIFKQKVEEPMFIPATLPELPEGDTSQ